MSDIASWIWVFIPLSGIGLAAVGIVTQHQQKLAKIAAESNSPELAKLASKLERIEQRLQVVERLAIDPAARLADDIERLRSAPMRGE